VAGFLNWKKAIDAVFAEGATRGSVPVFIENTAGGSNPMAKRLDRIAVLWEAISHSEFASHVGFTLDTCHAWAAGWDLATAVSDVKAITGRIDLIHLNDSRDAFNSGADRHAPLGKGSIPEELLVNIVKEAKAPVIIETHGDPATEINWLKARL
jgi:deoxyribonuclease-4